MIKKLKKYFFFQCYSSILFRRQQENPRLEEKGVEKCMGREKEREKERERAHARRRESRRESALAPPFICFFFHLGLPYANWAQPGVLFVLPEVLLWCWRRLSRVSWNARRFNQSILEEINPEYSLEGLMLKLNLQ